MVKFIHHSEEVAMSPVELLQQDASIRVQEAMERQFQRKEERAFWTSVMLHHKITEDMADQDAAIAKELVAVRRSEALSSWIQTVILAVASLAAGLYCWAGWLDRVFG